MKATSKVLWLFALLFSTGFSFAQIFSQQTGGGLSPATNILSLVPNQGILRIDYDFYSIPDRLDVYYENVDIFSSGLLQYSGEFDIPYGPGNSTSLMIVINQDGAIDPLTNWQYTPSIVPEPSSLALGCAGLVAFAWRPKRRRG